MLSITSGTGEISMRLMGTDSTVVCAPKMMFAVNGINIDVRADVVRRMFLVRLTTKYALVDENSHALSKSELMKLASELHPEVVRSFAVIRKAWFNAGCPPAPPCGGNLSEYPEWYRECVSPLYFAGFHDLLKNQKEMQSVDNSAETEGAEVIQCLSNLFGTEPFSAKSVQKAMLYDAELRNTGTVDGILNLCPDSIVDAAMSRRLTANSVGTWLKSYTDMKFAGYPKFLKKLPRTSAGNKYVIDDIEQQTVLV